MISPFLLSLLLLTITPIHASLPPPDHHSLPQLQLLKTSRTCCVNPGLTFDGCNGVRTCGYGRECLTIHSLFPCYSQADCICYPHRIIRCDHPSQCPRGETCASRPHESPFCVSEAVVNVDPTYIFIHHIPCCSSCTGCTNPPHQTGPFPSNPSASKPPPSNGPLPSGKPPTGPKPPLNSKPPFNTSPPSDTKPPTRPNPPSSTTPPAPSGPLVEKPPIGLPPIGNPPIGNPPTGNPPTGNPPVQKPPGTAIPPVSYPSPPPTPRPSPATPPPRPYKPPTITAIAPLPKPTRRPVTTGVLNKPLPSPSPGGLAGDRCDSERTCRGYRKCLHRDSRKPCSRGPDCVCMGSRVCVCNDQCTDGEVCCGAPGRSYCFSPKLVDALSWASTLPCVAPIASPEVEVYPGPPVTTPPPRVPPGLTGDDCRVDSNCRSSRRCIAGGGDSCAAGNILCDSDVQKCDASKRSCYCYALRRCNCSIDCEETEVCTATVQGRICMSRKVADTRDGYLQSISCPRTPDYSASDPILMVNEPIPEPPTILKATSKPSVAPVLPAISPGSATLGSEAGDPACIDASALSGLDSRELVFKNHVMKRVLCDAYGSCATAGHMVAYKGIGMMMKSYCTIVSCVEDTLEVNSPKLRRGIRIASKTEDLHFTAFAARYETQIEEMAMATAVRVGL